MPRGENLGKRKRKVMGMHENPRMKGENMRFNAIFFGLLFSCFFMC